MLKNNLRVSYSCMVFIVYFLCAASCAENPYGGQFYGSNPFPQPQYNFTMIGDQAATTNNPFQQPPIKFTLIGDQKNSSNSVVTSTPIVSGYSNGSTTSSSSGNSTRRKCGNCVNGREKYQVYGGSAPDKYCAECGTTGYPHTHRPCTVCGGQGWY